MSEETGVPNFEQQIEDIMAHYPKGVSNKVLQEAIPSMDVKQLVASLNKLISQDKIQILSKGKQLVYVLKNATSKKLESGDIEEKVIFDAVQSAGNSGVTARDLKYKCNLPQPQVTKILKYLEAKKLIKSVTSTSKKKLFMLCDLEPDRSITGGTFYSGQEFESEFVNVLGDQCYKYLVQARGLAEKLLDPIAQRNASLKSSKEVCEYITKLQISTVKLTVQDIEAILESLIYDDKVEKMVNVVNAQTSKEKTENFYRANKPLVTSVGLMRVPCGVCRIYKDCHVGGPISPATCVYMKEWLEF